jgi:RHH-type proline utilization regulon transcriptional repressor/proline dehydrogenase/delta 1-pyrroline-5-carboxylate dehydrogenase
VLYLQDDVADAMLEMIRGAFEALVIGDPPTSRPTSAR